ncbi:MAG TPA: oligosaccharide flippase family protein [Candidatus Woesebacteria bacterium]|mgnify:CR=1 FL=1|nr:oligosaccharide flippase family protein [Candidatus Woesebacteria bacterium]
MGYSHKVITGFSWDSVLNLFLYLLTIIKTFFLARVLSPSEFGLFSLVIIALGISEAITQTGINLTIIQSQHSVEYFLNTAWVIAIGRGFIIGILMILLGLGVNSHFHEPTLLPLISLAALIPIIKGFINPYVVVLHKKMQFLQDVAYRFLIQASLILLSLLLGLVLKNVYALVFAMIVAALIETFASFLLFKQRPIFEYIPSRAKEIFGNAKGLTVNSLFHYLVENLDDFLIGSLTSTYALGLYHNSYSLTHKISYEVAKSVHYGTIPVYTRLQLDQKRLRRAFLKTLFFTLGLTGAICTPIYIWHESIITFLLGPNWTETIPLIRPLIGAGIIQSVFMVCYTLMLAVKQYRWMNFHLLLSLISMTIMIVWFGRTQEITEAVMGLFYSRLLVLPLLIWIIWHQFFKEKERKCPS